MVAQSDRLRADTLRFLTNSNTSSASCRCYGLVLCRRSACVACTETARPVIAASNRRLGAPQCACAEARSCSGVGSLDAM